MSDQTHYYGDNCPGGHHSDPLPPNDPLRVYNQDSVTDSNISNASQKKLTGAFDSRIQELLLDATRHHLLANDYEDRASMRYAEIKQDELFVQRGRVSGGKNPVSKVIMEAYDAGETKGFDNIVDTRAAVDPEWCGYVSNNKFYTRKANLDNQMIQTFLKMKEMGLDES